MKVMLEEDYLSLQKHSGLSSPNANGLSFPNASVGNPGINKAHTLGSQVVREIVLPALEKEVNEGKNFAQLRQIYSAMILATWYKKALKESLLGKIYADKAKVKGVDQDPKANEAIYQQYLKAFKKGVYNYIKEDIDKYTHQAIPRKYFSGGFMKDFAMTGNRTSPVMQIVHAGDPVDPDLVSQAVDEVALGYEDSAMVDLAPNKADAAMGASDSDKGLYESFYRKRSDHDLLMVSVNPQRNGKDKNKVIRHDPQEARIGTNIIRPYIEELLIKVAEGKERFIVVTSREAAEQMKKWDFPELDTLLRKAIYVQSVHYGYLRVGDNYFEQAKRIEPHPQLVVAIGKGSAEDWGKIIGHKFDVDVDIIPTAVSTNAMWTSNVAIRDGEPGQSDYDVFGYVLGAARLVLVDTDFVRLAKRDNIAGAGDLFSSTVALQDWKLAIQHGAEREDPDIFRRAQAVLDELFAHADDIRENTPKGIEISARLGERISKTMSDFRSGRPKAGSDHILSDAIEVVTGSRHVLHGEQVAIATLLMAFLYNKHYPGTFNIDDLKAKVQALGLPLSLGSDGVDMTRDELIKALITAKPREGRYSFFNVHRVSDTDAREAVDSIFSDAAMAAKGGIDLNAANLDLRIKRDGKGVPLPLLQQDMAMLGRIEGFTPVIIAITPVTSLPFLSSQ